MIEYLKNPMTVEEIKKFRDADNYIAGVISIHISDMIDNDLEGFLDRISTLLVNNECLMDVNYEVVGINDTEKDEILLKVTGDVSSILEMKD